jgi:hypothetical protein
MRTTFFAALLLFVAVSFAEDWIEFQPPMMDDVTVDPLRFTQQGTPFDLSDPMFNPLEHGQSCKASRSGKTTKDKLAVNYEFTGREGLEYLEIRTKIKIDKPGFNIGGVFTTDLPKAGAIRVRINDPSGETHQHTLGYPKGTPIFAKIETSPDGIWGGDGDKKLQFPCEIVSILLDKPEPGFKGKGALEITDLVLYETVELRDVLKIEFAADSPPGFLFEGNGTLKLRLTPKNLKEGEKLFMVDSDLRSAYGEHWVVKAGYAEYKDRIKEFRIMIGEIGDTDYLYPSLTDIEQFKINRMFYDDKFKEFQKNIATKIQLAEAMEKLYGVSSDGTIFEIHVDTPGAARIVLYPNIVMPDYPNKGSEISALPVSFPFGSIKPNTPLDDRLGVCTHYQQGWNTNSLDFVAKAGFGMIRDEMTWGNVEREKGVLVLPNYAAYIDKVLEKKIEPLLILNYSNRFYDNNNFPVSDEAVAGFANYSRFLAEQFKGRVKYFEVWNEWTGGC